MPSSSGPFSAGFITSSQADTLNQALVELQSLREVINNSNLNQAYTQPENWEIFRAKLTAYDEASGYFDWIEQAFEGTAGGDPYDKPFGRFGTYQKNPASLMPGFNVPANISEDTPVQCLILQKGFTGIGTLEYEVVSLPAPCTRITRSFVTKVCPTVTKNSGVVTDISFLIEHTVLSVCAEELYDPTCTTGDADCCPNPIVTVCCGAVPIPSTLTMTIAGTDDYACFNGGQVCYQYSTTAAYYDPPVGSRIYFAGWVPVASSFGDLIPSPGVYNWFSIPNQTCGDYQGSLNVGPLLCLEDYFIEPGIVGWGGYLSGSSPGGPTSLITTYAYFGLQIFPTDFTQCPASIGIEQLSCDPFILTETLACTTSIGTSPTGSIAYEILETVLGDCGTAPSDCCATTENRPVSVAATGDFADLDDAYFMTYDPAAINTIFNSATDYDGRFQWYATMHDPDGASPTPYIFFGCLAGAYYFGFAGNGITNPLDYADAGCFPALTVHTTAFTTWYSVVATFGSCAVPPLASVAISGNATAGCSGAIGMTT